MATSEDRRRALTLEEQNRKGHATLGPKLRRRAKIDFRREATVVPDTTPIDYDFYVRLARGLTRNPLSEREFNDLAGSRAVPQFEREVRGAIRQRQRDYEPVRQLEEKFAPQDQSVALQGELSDRLQRTQEDLVRLGQHDEDTAVDFRNIAQTAAVLFEIEGDDEASAEARRYGAQILSEHGARLAPHLDATLEPGWLANNSDRIESILTEDDPEGFGKVLDIGARAVGEVLNFPAVKVPLDTLHQVEQAWFRSVSDVARAADMRTDRDAKIDYLQDAGATAARGFGSLFTAGQSERFGYDPTSLITVGDETFSLDRDQSGDANLREVLGIDPEAGGFAGDIGDLIGTILLDPTTYLTLGAKPSGKIVTTALSQADDPLARRVGIQLANGAKLKNLDDVSQAAARSELLRYQIDAVGNPRNAELVRRNLRRSPGDVIRHLRGEADSTDRLIENLIKSRTDRLTKAAERGIYPAIRIGNRTVLPMRRLYNALGIIDTRLASDDAWAQRAVQMVDIEDTDELLHFIQTYSGQAMTDDLRDQMSGWNAMAGRMSDDPETWLDDLLQRSATGAEDETFDQIEAFGRALLGDGPVADWRNWYSNSWAGRTVTDPNLPLGARRIPFVARGDLEVPGGQPLRRTVRALDPTSLSDEAQARIAYNMDVFDRPAAWIAADGIKPRGLRSAALRDNVVSNLFRRMSDALSPRAGIRRTGDLGDTTARQVESLQTINRAKRQMVTDHVDRLDISRAGESRLYQRASDELTEDLDEYLNDVLSRAPDDINDELTRLATEGLESTHQLVRTLNDIRDDIYRMSVGAGADEEVLLAMRGYLPRTFSEEATQRAERAAIPGSSTASELEAFQRFGLEPDSNVIAPSNPLTQGGAVRGRSFERDIQDLYDVNDAAREELRQAGLDGLDGFDLYEANPLRATLLRSREAHEAYAWMDMVTSMTKLSDANGRPLAYMARSADDLPTASVRMAGDDATFGKANYVSRELPNGGGYWVRREISDEIERVNNVIRDPASLSRFRRFMTRWNDIWGAWATVPLVGTAFHARNATGNLFNMVVAGARNPGVLADSFRLQRLHRRAVLEMRSSGTQYSEALRAVGADEATSALLRDARKFDIIGSGQTSDIFTGVDDLAGRRGVGSLSPFNQTNPVLQSGRAVGQGIESNARLALFLDGKIHKGMGSEDAASRVRQFLFDYNDLTPFESNTMRMLSRFYTFARKNTALQTRMLMTQPGRVHNAQRITDEFTDQVMSAFGFEREGGSPEPGLNQAGERIPNWVKPTLGMYRDSEGNLILAGADTPLNAASDVVDGLAAFLKVPPALVRRSMAGSEFEQEQREEQLRDHIGEALGLLSGGPVEGTKTVFEFGTGQDLFIGGNLSDIDRNWLDTLFRITDTVAPVFGKLDREAEYLGIYENLGIAQDEDRPDRNQGQVRLLNTLLGLTIRPDMSDPDQITRNMNSLSYELGRSLDEVEDDLREAGIEPLRFEEMLEAGGNYNRDRAYEFMLYKTLDGSPITPEELKELRNLVPKNVLEAAGVNLPPADRREWDANEQARRVREIATALQALGIEVTQEMMDALVLRESGARLSDVKDIGIEPSFQRNPWLDATDPKEANRLRQEQSIDQLAQLSELLGISVAELQERYPLLQPAERTASQMAEAGFTDNEIVTELTEQLSRQERALIFGEGSLEQSYSYEALTPEEQIKFQQKAARVDAELRVIMQITIGRQPTQAELDEWLSEVLFLAPEQRKLGFDNYTPPRRENLTPDSVYDERLRQRVEAAREVTDFLGP